MSAHDRNPLNVEGISRKYANRTRLNFILRLYLFLGLILGLGGVIVSTPSFQKFIEDSARTPKAFALAGVFISFFSAMILFVMRSRNVDHLEKEMIAVLFLREWVNFESNLDRAIVELGAEAPKGAINRKLEALKTNGIFDELDVITASLALQIRNRAVHEADFGNPERLEFVIKSLRTLSGKLVKSNVSRKS